MFEKLAQNLNTKKNMIKQQLKHFYFQRSKQRVLHDFHTHKIYKPRFTTRVYSINTNNNHSEIKNKEFNDNSTYLKKSDHMSKFIYHLLDKFYINSIGVGKLNNEEFQRRIETLIINEFDDFFSNNTKDYIMGGVNMNILSPSLTKYILSKEGVLKDYIIKFKKHYKETTTIRKDQLFIRDILSIVDKEFLHNLCLVHFLMIYTYQNSDNDKNYNTLKVSISIGNKILNRYFNLLREKYNLNNEVEISYSDYLGK